MTIQMQLNISTRTRALPFNRPGPKDKWLAKSSRCNERQFVAVARVKARSLATDVAEVIEDKVDKSVVILPGLGNSAGDYSLLEDILKEMGLEVETCQVRRIDWLRNAAGLTDLNYWQGTLNPRPTVDWYLDKIEAAVDNIKTKSDGTPITLLAHSAGGWLGRLYMRDYGTAGIENFITLGSPHTPPPKDKGVFDQTRGILFHCEQEIPGAFHSSVNYVTIAGKYVKGCEWNSDGSFREKIIGLGYKQVCGDADVWGDGVVPNKSSHLEGALNLDLTDVYHSPVGSKDGTRNWYGSKSTLEQWIENLIPVRS